MNFIDIQPNAHAQSFKDWVGSVSNRARIRFKSPIN